MVKTGLENLIDHPLGELKNKRLGLLCNPASVNSDLIHASILIDRQFEGQLAALFSPQHGFYADKQDNMIESDHIVEPELKIPVFSLYGETRIPTQEMFENIDVLLVDIQDVGTRVYTFIYTVSYCLEVAAAMNKKVIILDRPNPIGGYQVEGNLLANDFRSFVGRYELPMRHGLTIGEVCHLFNESYNIGCNLETIPMSGWSRDMYWSDTGRIWIPPSPNLPTPLSAMVYPGQVIFEGTNLSEGRGTTLPFELFGAPYLDCNSILDQVKNDLKGVHLRKANFEPTSNKWKGETCNGFHIHVLSREKYNSYLTSLSLLQAIIRFHTVEFAYKAPPYEYEYDKKPIDLILGNKAVRNQIESGASLNNIQQGWMPDLVNFKKMSKRFYLYE